MLSGFVFGAILQLLIRLICFLLFWSSSFKHFWSDSQLKAKGFLEKLLRNFGWGSPKVTIQYRKLLFRVLEAPNPGLVLEPHIPDWNFRSFFFLAIIFSDNGSKYIVTASFTTYQITVHLNKPSVKIRWRLWHKYGKCSQPNSKFCFILRFFPLILHISLQLKIVIK